MRRSWSLIVLSRSRSGAHYHRRRAFWPLSMLFCYTQSIDPDCFSRSRILRKRWQNPRKLSRQSWYRVFSFAISAVCRLSTAPIFLGPFVKRLSSAAGSQSLVHKRPTRRRGHRRVDELESVMSDAEIRDTMKRLNYPWGQFDLNLSGQYPDGAVNPSFKVLIRKKERVHSG